MADAYAIRLYGRRWLQMTPRPDQDDAANGWRALSWTDDVAKATKWASAGSAEEFRATLPDPTVAEVREIQPASAPTPTGGRLRIGMYGNTEVYAA